MFKKQSRTSLAEIFKMNEKAMQGLCNMAGKPMPDELRAPVVAPRKPRAEIVKSEIPSEHVEQKAFVKWFRMQYPKVRIFSIPNAAARSPELASYLKAEGMSKGVPDLFIPEWLLWIEMKRVKGSVITTEQKDWAEYLTMICNHRHIFGFGFEDVKAKVKQLEEYK